MTQTLQRVDRYSNREADIDSRGNVHGAHKKSRPWLGGGLLGACELGDKFDGIRRIRKGLAELTNRGSDKVRLAWALSADID